MGPPLLFAAMPSEKRQRQDEGRLMRLEAQRTATQKVQRKRQARTLGLIIGARRASWPAASRSSAPTTPTTASTTDTSDTTDTTSGSETVVLPGAGASITGETPCPPADGSAERTTSFEQAPPMCIDPAKTYTATLETTEGDIVIELDAANAPETVNNFVVLVPLPLLRQRAVPPHRPGLREPGRRPRGPHARHRWPRLHDPRRAARPTRPPPTRPAPSPWRTAVPRAAAASSSS